MRNETAIEGMRGLHCRELIGQLWVKKDMLSLKKEVLPLKKDTPFRCQSIPSLPLAPEYCIHGAARISIKVGSGRLIGQEPCRR